MCPSGPPSPSLEETYCARNAVPCVPTATGRRRDISMLYIRTHCVHRPTSGRIETCHSLRVSVGRLYATCADCLYSQFPFFKLTAFLVVVFLGAISATGLFQNINVIILFLEIAIYLFCNCFSVFECCACSPPKIIIRIPCVPWFLYCRLCVFVFAHIDETELSVDDRFVSTHSMFERT